MPQKRKGGQAGKKSIPKLEILRNFIWKIFFGSYKI